MNPVLCTNQVLASKMLVERTRSRGFTHPRCWLSWEGHHDHGNSYKEKHLTGACFIVIKTGSKVAHRQTKPWRRSWEFYIQVSR